MRTPDRRAFILSALALSACGSRDAALAQSKPQARPEPPLYPNETPELRALIYEYADFYEVPRDLVQRVVVRESTHRPNARNGIYRGLMQLAPATARSMGHTGPTDDLLDAETNLRFGVKYLRGAWLISDGSYDQAVKHYSRGYWDEAKRRGMLVETGLAPE